MGEGERGRDGELSRFARSQWGRSVERRPARRLSGVADRLPQRVQPTDQARLTIGRKGRHDGGIGHDGRRLCGVGGGRPTLRPCVDARDESQHSREEHGDRRMSAPTWRWKRINHGSHHYAGWKQCFSRIMT